MCLNAVLFFCNRLFIFSAILQALLAGRWHFLASFVFLSVVEYEKLKLVAPIKALFLMHVVVCVFVC